MLLAMMLTLALAPAPAWKVETFKDPMTDQRTVAFFRRAEGTAAVRPEVGVVCVGSVAQATIATGKRHGDAVGYVSDALKKMQAEITAWQAKMETRIDLLKKGVNPRDLPPADLPTHAPKIPVVLRFDADDPYDVQTWNFDRSQVLLGDIRALGANSRMLTAEKMLARFTTTEAPPVVVTFRLDGLARAMDPYAVECGLVVPVPAVP